MPAAAPPATLGRRGNAPARAEEGAGELATPRQRRPGHAPVARRQAGGGGGWRCGLSAPFPALPSRPACLAVTGWRRRGLVRRIQARAPVRSPWPVVSRSPPAFPRLGNCASSVSGRTPPYFRSGSRRRWPARCPAVGAAAAPSAAPPLSALLGSPRAQQRAPYPGPALRPPPPPACRLSAAKSRENHGRQLLLGDRRSPAPLSARPVQDGVCGPLPDTLGFLFSDMSRTRMCVTICVTPVKACGVLWC